jgi:3-oxoacyl-[acyl-carrier-protein] synthase II
MVTKQCILSVLKDAGCTVDDLAFLIPHGSGTKKGDRSELNSIKDVLDGRKDLPLCGLKPYTGHMGAASDLAEIIFGMKAVRDKTVPATLNFNSAEKAFSELSISNSAQACSKSNFLSVSYGVGGQSSSVIISTG